MDNNTIRIAFLGPQGSYSHIASTQYANTHHFNKLKEYSCENFNEIIQLIQHKQVQYGILPIENSTSGSIDEVYDILQNTQLFLIGEIHILIKHAILTIPNTSLEKIQTLYSHPQPLQQCSKFLNNFPQWNFIFCKSSSDAMEKISKTKHPNFAALGNEKSGQLLYGLHALKRNVANTKNNITRFIILGYENIKIDKNILAKTTLSLFTNNYQSNIFNKITSILHKCNIKKYRIITKSINNNPKKKILFIDIEANLYNKKTQYAIKKIQDTTVSLKILGCYPKG